MTEPAAMADLLARLKANHPDHADRLSLSRRGNAIGLDLGDCVAILYDLAPDGRVIDCRLGEEGGWKYLTFPREDW